MLGLSELVVIVAGTLAFVVVTGLAVGLAVRLGRRTPPRRGDED